jgi:hypothetical protein
MKIIIDNITRKEAEHALKVLDSNCSSMGEDEPGEFYKAGCRKVMFAIEHALEKKS